MIFLLGCERAGGLSRASATRRSHIEIKRPRGAASFICSQPSPYSITQNRQM